MEEPTDHQLNVQSAAQSSMDDGTSSSNPVPISQVMEFSVRYDELPTLPPEASFASVDDLQVDEHVVTHGIPCCPENQKPRIGMSFPSAEVAVSFYRKYALLVNFDVRCGTARKYKDGTLRKKYFYCNRQGFPLSISFDTSNGKRIRNCPSQRCGCEASMVIEQRGSLGYVVTQFVEAHNHGLATGLASQFLRGKRKLSTLHQHFIVGLSKANTGPVKAHKIAKQLFGDYANVGAQEVEFRNFHRDVVQYIGEHDAQMVLDNLTNKKKSCSSYFYEYSVVNGAISRIFWADPICQLNFKAFGDVVTFDATYSLNRYKMIFVPFTGIDNHKNSITFAAALLSREDVESYTWLLNSFLKCMGRAPDIVLTDQDPSLRVVVPKVMPGTHHRFCIWHIMKKLSVKVSHHQLNQHFACTCRLFERVGILCRHVFAALKYAGIRKIPAKYVLNRWTKTAIEIAAQGADPCLVEDCQTIEQPVVAEQELWTEFNACVNLAANDTLKTEYFHHKLKEIRVHFEEVSAGESVRCKSTIIGELIGASNPTEVLVKPPAVVHTKGSGKRLESEFEKAINKPERAPRMCKFCLTLGNHDSRNCPLKEQLNDPK
ncbi:hypothetical protein QQ045_006530 [Rhodiola kirilowii]